MSVELPASVSVGWPKEHLAEPGIVVVDSSTHLSLVSRLPGWRTALALAWREDVTVYDGSPTAWTADDSLPLVTGPDPR